MLEGSFVEAKSTPCRRVRLKHAPNGQASEQPKQKTAPRHSNPAHRSTPSETPIIPDASSARSTHAQSKANDSANSKSKAMSPEENSLDTKASASASAHEPSPAAAAKRPSVKMSKAKDTERTARRTVAFSDDPLNEAVKQSDEQHPRATAAEGSHVDPSAYPYGKEGMLEISSSSQPATPHQQFCENPRVIYPNGDSLSRPLTIPDSARTGIVVLVIAACVIAAGMLWAYFDATTNEPKRQQALLEEQLGKEVSLDLPSLLTLVELDDASIDEQLKSAGYTLFERKPVGSGDVYEVVKLPDDMSLVDAGALYATGINKLTATQAVSLLNGSWDLSVDRKSNLNISLHYADFKSGSLETAISNAIAAENLERGGISDSGEDDGFGNAYSTGTVMISGDSYSWTVSAIPLLQVYSLAGIPDDAVYVGIRIKSLS